jgi:hypothetical protein
MNNQEILDNAQKSDNEVEFIGNGEVQYLNNPFKANRSLADVKRIVELESLLKKFRPMDENGDGWDFVYNEGSEYLGAAVLEALKVGV